MLRLYHTNERDTARYVMGEIGPRTLVALGVNPSRATFERMDVTVSKVKGFSRRNGYDGWLMLNLYPQRATLPTDLHQRRQARLHEANLGHIEAALAQVPEPTLWAAWGNLIEARPYFWRCWQDIHACLRPLGAHWVQLGTLTQQGHPRHPSRMGYATAFQPFEVDDYE